MTDVVRILVLSALLGGAIQRARLSHEFGIHQERVKPAALIAFGSGSLAVAFVALLELWK
jgi:hypothetical protein